MDNTICIIGNGYVGLTAGIYFAKVGKKVLLYDIDPAVVDEINNGKPRGGNFLEYLGTDVVRLVQDGGLRATNNWEDVIKQDVFIVAVPSERRDIPDMSIVTTVVTDLIAQCAHTPIVLIESTITPGTVDGIINSIPDKIVGKDYFLAVCPRRDWFGDAAKNVSTLCRVIGGVTPACTAVAVSIYQSVISSNSMYKTTYKVSEITKSLENAMLHVQVMFAQEMAFSYPSVDIAEAVELMGTHWRLTPLHLGFGTSGRCIPIGPKYLREGTNMEMPILDAALGYNSRIQDSIASLVLSNSPAKSSVLLLGLSYRPKLRDIGCSPSLAIARLIRQWAPERLIAFSDPLFTDDEIVKITGFPAGNLDNHWDSVLLATPHEEFINLPENRDFWRKGQYAIDASGHWAKYKNMLLQRGVRYIQLGRPGWMGTTWAKQLEGTHV